MIRRAGGILPGIIHEGETDDEIICDYCGTVVADGWDGS